MLKEVHNFIKLFSIAIFHFSKSLPSKIKSFLISERLKELSQEGISNIQIFCPGFVSDCLETLEEVGQEAKTIFLNSNGNRFDFIKCLNSDDGFMNMLENIVLSKEKEF